MNNKYCIIGDLHGRISTLERIISRSPGYHFVFLGDIIHHKPFFKRTKKTPTLEMLNRVRGLCETGNASLVMGNNEFYILKYLLDSPNGVKKKELKNTLKSIKNLPINERLDLLRWISNLPLTLCLEDKYFCSHAYYHTDDKMKNLFGLGYPWFREDSLQVHISSDQSKKYFFGHYGYPYSRKNLMVLDATNFEGVGVYYTDKDEFMVYY